VFVFCRRHASAAWAEGKRQKAKGKGVDALWREELLSSCVSPVFLFCFLPFAFCLPVRRVDNARARRLTSDSRAGVGSRRRGASKT
jgi:hypothetical protein